MSEFTKSLSVPIEQLDFLVCWARIAAARPPDIRPEINHFVPMRRAVTSLSYLSLSLYYLLSIR